MKNLKNTTLAGKKVLGWTEEFNTCECCGKSELKGTWFCEMGNGLSLHFGSVCVFKNMNMTAKEVKNSANETMKNETNKRWAMMQSHPELLSLESERKTKKDQVMKSGQRVWGHPELTAINNRITEIKSEINSLFPFASKTKLWFS